MSKNRFYIGQNPDANEDGNLEEWVSSRIPNPPAGTLCECEHDVCHEDDYRSEDDSGCANEAVAHLYRIEGNHVCYTFMCDQCVECQASEDWMEGMEYPTTGDGYAVVPKYCS